jgi:hypothetical protein
MFSSTSGWVSARLYRHVSTPGEALVGGTPHFRKLLRLWGLVRPGR